MLGCAAVVTVPAVVAAVAKATVPEMFPAGIDVRPAPDPLNWLPVICPLAEINPAVIRLPPVTLPTTLTATPVNNADTILPPETLPVADTPPAVIKLPTVAFPVAEI